MEKKKSKYQWFDDRKLDLLGETIVMLSADLYNDLYEIMGDEADFTAVATEIRDAAVTFEQTLDWDNNKEKLDYMTELHKFEDKMLEEWRNLYSNC